MIPFKIKLKNKQIAELTIVFLAAAGLIGYGVQTAGQRYQATHNPDPVIAKAVVTHSTDAPDETKPTDACAAYKADAKHPERLYLKSLGVSGCVEQVGTDQHDAVAVPSNIYVAGWFVDSVLPGQEGLSIIDGHISGRFKTDAIFQHLNKLKTGDVFTMTLGGGDVLKYEVLQEQTVSLNDASKTLFTKDPNVKSQLNLITCGGQYDEEAKTYELRVIVSAKLIE